MKDIILIGAGGHARACIDVLEATEKFHIIGLVGQEDEIGKEVYGYPVIDCDENLPRYIKEPMSFLVAIGQIHTVTRRKEMYEKLKNMKANLPPIVSPLARVSRYAHIGKGTIVMHQALLNAGCRVGENCIINTRALIEHDSIVGSHCHVSTGVLSNGSVKIGDEVFIGSRATVANNVEICKGSFIRAGSVII